MRSIFCGPSTVALLMVGCLCGCNDDSPEARQQSIPPLAPSNQPLRVDAPDGANPARDQKPDNAEEGFATTDDGRSRAEKTKPDALTGWKQTAAPIRYVRTAVRQRQAASDKLKTIQANRALEQFKLFNDGKMPKSLKELNDWYIKNVHPDGLPEPDNGGIYALDKRTNKLVITDPE